MSSAVFFLSKKLRYGLIIIIYLQFHHLHRNSTFLSYFHYQVFASDADSGPNAELEYHLKSGINRFKIDSDTGELESRGRLKFEDTFDLLVSRSSC